MYAKMHGLASFNSNIPVINLSNDARALSSKYWLSQFVAFLYRPNHFMLNTTIIPMVRTVFHDEFKEALFPKRFIGIFMRAGDKFKEAKLMSPNDFFERLDNRSRQFGISHVYINSDSLTNFRMIQELAGKSRPDLKLYFISYNRSESGLTLAQLRMKFSTRHIRELINIALTDLWIQKHAHFWIGTLSSNWCRFINELRLANGGYGVRYETLDCPGENYRSGHCGLA